MDDLFMAREVECIEHARACQPGRQRVKTVADLGERAHAAIIPGPDRTDLVD
jgi:hypothetical protein